MSKIDYKSAGVDIDAGNEAVDRIKDHVKSTFSPHVLTGLGSFGSMFDLTEIVQGYEKPVMIQSIDGVGTKVSVGKMAGKFYGLGIDVVSATSNDIIVHGATPLTFLDYVANSKLVPSIVEEIVRGMTDTCKENGISLVGGETAEMPGTYQRDEHDIVGCVTGIVERDKLINGSSIQSGDVIIGLASSGLQTNGYSLARKAFFEVGGYTTESNIPELGTSVGEALLAPHVNYKRPVFELIESEVEVHGMAHLTGGGFFENVPRILPNNCRAEIDIRNWPNLPVFEVIQQIGNVEVHEMFRTFNMGIGYIIVVREGDKDSAMEILKKYEDIPAYVIGQVIKGPCDVHLHK
ncbi:MAG: phosphoribosylformylglycinamidine cyclo-ligase [Opitutales bacterium]|jgi:phosphoribosylformylglycinamidine cyclo-ligase|nr:phosphoribosylformylglycinamidine cyclo-ligase [Opitutales bacterium]MDG2167696.1 phosphoribosylformylglycinamidine cyclo-ligase [Opitutales bacterium]